MSAGAIGGTAALDPTNRAAGASSSPFGDITTEEFVNILVAELTQQDPFQPNDSAAVLEQLSSLRNIESDLALQENLESLVQQNALSSAASFIGRFVQGKTDTGLEMQGIVEAMAIENGEAILKLDNGDRLPASRVSDVTDIGDLDTQVVQQLLGSLLTVDSSALLGKRVAGLDANDQPVDGVVTGVRKLDTGIHLELDTGQSIPAGNVTRFLDK